MFKIDHYLTVASMAGARERREAHVRRITVGHTSVNRTSNATMSPCR
jgi:hypothetical protein